MTAKDPTPIPKCLIKLLNSALVYDENNIDIENCDVEIDWVCFIFVALLLLFVVILSYYLAYF